MKMVIPVSFLLISSVYYISCGKCGCGYFPEPGNWAKVSELPLNGRSEAVSFTIGNFAYLGSGLDSSNGSLGDFWKYDPVKNSWEQVASLPKGAERSSAVGFSVGNTAICGTGFNGSNYLNDFYRYDPVSNSWTKINSAFPGKARSEAVAFGIDSSGYVGTGYDGNNALADFYRYNPSDDSWTSIPFNEVARYSSVVFVFNKKAYLVTGTNGNTLVSEFLVFDPAKTSGNWTPLQSITNASSDAFDDSYTTIMRQNGAAFLIGDKAYISTGEDRGSPYTYTWEYDFAVDLWVEKTPFEGPPVTGAVGISVNNRGFIATGKNQRTVSDFSWEFQPNLVMNPNDN
ncbi:MAG TPA: kelch repeat-containing protein [Puia sp.]